MREQLENILSRVKAELSAIQDTSALEQLRVKVMGKKGEFTDSGAWDRYRRINDLPWGKW